MAKLKFYKLHFSTPLHLGDSRDDYSISLQTIQSDTIYAALTSCLAKIGKEIPENGDLGFSVSSLFPFYQKKEEKAKTEENSDKEAGAETKKENSAVYFFPKPLRQTLPKLKDVEKAKTIKKVSWIDKDHFERVLAGDVLFEKENDINNVKGKFLTEKEIDNNFIDGEVSPRVLVSRTMSEDAMPFYMDRIYFKDYSGLFFIAEGDTLLLDKALNILQYEGIGTDRNIGNGLFSYDMEEVDMKLPEESDYAVSMSMFIPESKVQLDNMVSGNKVAYDFTRRGGWITTAPFNTFRKNTIYSFMPDRKSVV